MGLLRQALETRATLRVPPKWMLEAFGGTKALSGIRVTPEKALTYTAVYACVRVLAETLAMLPLKTYERLVRGKRAAPLHPNWRLLHDRANPETTAFEYREFQMGNLQLRGNSYAFIERRGDGRPLHLWPLRSDQVEVKLLADKTLQYDWKQGERIFNASQIHHVHGLSTDGVTGLSPLTLMREAVGMGLAHEEYGSRFFSQGANSGGVLKHKGELGTGAQKRLKRTFQQATEGLLKAHKTMILEEGMDWTKIGVDPKNAQFLEGRKFQVTEIARAFRVPPHLIADLENATFSNIEHQGQEFVTYSMQPWFVRHEQAYLRDLFPESEAGRFFAEFLVAGLLRGDTPARTAYYSGAIAGGWMHRNEVRELENLNPKEGLDDFLVPMNMTTIDENGRPVVTTFGPGGAPVEPGTEPAPTATPPGDPGLGVASDIQSTLLNGAQVTSMIAIVTSVAERTLPRDSGLRILETAFGISAKEAAELMATAGTSFSPPGDPGTRSLPVKEIRAATSSERLALRSKYAALFQAAAEKMLRAESVELRKNAKSYLSVRSRLGFDKWLEEYYRDDFPELAKRTLEPIYQKYADEIGPLALAEINSSDLPEEFRDIAERYAESHATRYAKSSSGQIIGALEGRDGDPVKAIDEKLELWSTTRPAREGKRNGSQAGEALTKAVFVAAGFSAVWRTQGDSCKLCNELNGKKVGGSNSFVGKGQTLAPKGTAPLTVSQNITHAPLHEGCDCYITAG